MYIFKWLSKYYLCGIKSLYDMKFTCSCLFKFPTLQVNINLVRTTPDSHRWASGGASDRQQWASGCTMQ